MGLVLWIASIPFNMILMLPPIFRFVMPLVGISLVAWPVGLLLIVSVPRSGGNIRQNIFVIGAFLLVIANIDNVQRPALIPEGAQLNPAIELLTHSENRAEITEGSVLTINQTAATNTG
jgi:hypothetical protein